MRAPEPSVPPPGWVVGVDGCRAGWVAVAGAPAGGPLEAAVLRSFGEVAAWAAEAAVVAVDIPIGLPATGPRAADREARGRLGRRRASVFDAPVRVVLDASDHAEANVRSRAVSGRGLSAQSWALVPRIAEVDRFLADRPAWRSRVREAHPELAFALMAGEPARHAKRTGEGASERRRLVECHVGAVPRRPPGAATDDLLDACALVWTARRILAGRALTLGGGVDSRGLPMVIHA